MKQLNEAEKACVTALMKACQNALDTGVIGEYGGGTSITIERTYDYGICYRFNVTLDNDLATEEPYQQVATNLAFVEVVALLGKHLASPACQYIELPSNPPPSKIKYA